MDNDEHLTIEKLQEELKDTNKYTYDLNDEKIEA